MTRQPHDRGSSLPVHSRPQPPTAAHNHFTLSFALSISLVLSALVALPHLCLLLQEEEGDVAIALSNFSIFCGGLDHTVAGAGLVPRR